MSVSNTNKLLVCERYKIYLEIIYTFGNKVMLLNQLYQYAEQLGLARSFSSFYSGIMELVNAEVLRKESFTSFGKKTQLQMLTLRKFGIRFIEGKESSYNVASVPKSGGNERILVSLFKNCYIINKVIPRIQKESEEVTFDNIVKMLNRDYSTALLNKNQGIYYLTKIRSDKKLQHFFDINEVDHTIKKMQDIKKKHVEGLKKGSGMSEGKGIGKTHS